MIAARRGNRRATGKPLENKEVSSSELSKNKIDHKKKTKEPMVEKGPPVRAEEVIEDLSGEIPELPFMEATEIINADQDQRSEESLDQIKVSIPKGEFGFSNRAPLQADERARELLRSTLQHPISLTAEDLLNVSEPMRQELKKLLTKKRVEKKTESDNRKIDRPWRNVSNVVENKMISRLPDATCEILSEDKEGLTKGSIVIGDPVLQYLSTLQPGEKPKTIREAEESQALRAIYPMINGVGEVESLLDSGSQIISMSQKVAKELEVTWDPDITVEMESANRSIERTLGLAKNVPFLCGYIRVYLQVHIMANPAYKVLLGRPFDIITESLVKNERDGNQTLTLTDPNTGERCTMSTHERGKTPDVIRKSVKEDFRKPLMK
jgi:hypothetical protein